MTADDDERSFPPTAWTVLLTARDPAAPEARTAREEICKAYWRPVFTYLEPLGLEKTEAEDAAQTVLADFCNGGWLERVDRAQGRLRHFFKAAARHALYNHRRHANAVKRGSGAEEVALDDAPDYAEPAAPDAAFDQPWAWTIFDRAMHSLEESYALRGKSALLDALKPALISTDELKQPAEIGSAFGVKEAQIRIEIHRLRRRLAERLRGEVAATLGPSASDAEIEEATRYLVQTLAHERRD